MSDSACISKSTPDEMTDINAKKVNSEVNTMWIDTYYWNFRWDFKNVLVHNSMTSGLSTFAQGRINELLGNVYFYFKIQKNSNETFSVSMYRIFKKAFEKRDDGVVLEVILALVGHGNTLGTQFMSHSIDEVTRTYNIDQMPNSPLCSWNVRCTMKLHEMKILPAEVHIQQELFKTVKSTAKDEFSKIYNDMAFLLEKQACEDILSGRQSEKFSISKACLVRRTLKFSHEIVAKVKAQNHGLPHKPNPPADIYLCYIRNEKERFICEKEFFELYVMAHSYGLPYLAQECREFMKKHMERKFLLDMIRYAELTYDEEFLKELVQLFVKYYYEIKKFPRCQMPFNENPRVTQIVMDSILRTLVREDLSKDKTRVEFMKCVVGKELRKLSKMIDKKDADVIAEKENSTKQESPIANVSDQQSPTAKFSTEEKSPKQKPIAENSSYPECAEKSSTSTSSDDCEYYYGEESSEEDDQKLESTGEKGS